MKRCDPKIIDRLLEPAIMMVRAETYIDKMLELNPGMTIDQEDLVSFLTNYTDEAKAVKFAEQFRDIYYPTTFTQCSVCNKEIIDRDICECPKGDYTCTGRCHSSESEDGE